MIPRGRKNDTRQNGRNFTFSHNWLCACIAHIIARKDVRHYAKHKLFRVKIPSEGQLLRMTRCATVPVELSRGPVASAVANPCLRCPAG